MRAWGACISTGYLVLGALGWALAGVPPVFFAGCAVVTLGVFLLGAPLMRRRPDDGDDGGSASGPDDPGSDDPPWWPGFEREFREYEERQGPSQPLTPS